jgi:hypothetical protein
MNWLSDILATGSGAISANETPKTTGAVNPALEALLKQVEIEVINKPSGSSVKPSSELDDFEAMLARIGGDGSPNYDSAPINREARRNRVYGGPELLLSHDGFEQIHSIADHGHSEIVKLPRQLLIDLLIDHSKLIAKLYVN